MKIKIKGLIMEDFVNYKEPCMTIEFPNCDFKCDKENGNQLCQNYALQFEDDIKLDLDEVLFYYLDNSITKAIVFQGLEPFFNKKVLYAIIKKIRTKTSDPIVIYTGFTEEELEKDIKKLQRYENIIIKFGRYRPNQKPHYDETLGVNLASENQYAKVIS